MRRELRWATILLLCVGVVAYQSSSSAAENAGQLERITIGPRTATRTVGEVQHFTVMGHYVGGGTRNLTQKVEYVSSDPAVAKPLNAKGDQSRIDALAPGTVTITATDPKTGISSRTSGDDATLIVVGALERITLSPTMVVKNIGQMQRFTATGHYVGGATRNLTQRLEYRSSNPEVASVANTGGDKSRVDIVGVGSATISATDPVTGVSSSAAGGDASVTVTSGHFER